MGAKEIILNHLQKMAIEDQNFKDRLEDKNKSIDGCMSYITVQARKKSSNNVAVISDEDVFKWAAHYYQEATVKEEPAPSCTISTDKKAPEIKKPIMNKKVEHKAIELDLFGGLS